MNGGAGRVICSIPAFEKLAETDEDFIIVCEGGTDMFKGHPILQERVYDNWHKGLFEQHLKHRDIITPEPYRLWEYYNQKCSLTQAFDILINNQGIRNLQKPTIVLNKMEIVNGYNVVQEVKAKTGFDKVVVIQPFGRGVQNTGEFVIDPSSRSLHLNNVIEIINELKTEYAVILMSEFPVALDDKDSAKYPVAMPNIGDIRVWASVIDIADHFIGCDSVGQHIARAFDKTATVITGSTFPVNITYPEYDKFDIIDLGEGKRIYSPIRISMEEHIDRLNDEVMDMNKQQIQQVLQSARKRLGKSTRFKGTYQPPVEQQSCCTPANTDTPALFTTTGGSLKPIQNNGDK